MALSTISYTRWCRPEADVEPIYMPGRLRTASSPSSTWISDAPYSWAVWVVFISFNSLRSSAMMFLRYVLQI